MLLVTLIDLQLNRCLYRTINDVFSVEYRGGWPWNVVYGPLKVIGNGTIRYISYEFHFVFHCYYDRILYRFRNKARYFL